MLDLFFFASALELSSNLRLNSTKSIFTDYITVFLYYNVSCTLRSYSTWGLTSHNLSIALLLSTDSLRHQSCYQHHRIKVRLRQVSNSKPHNHNRASVLFYVNVLNLYHKKICNRFKLVRAVWLPWPQEVSGCGIWRPCLRARLPCQRCHFESRSEQVE